MNSTKKIDIEKMVEKYIKDISTEDENLVNICIKALDNKEPVSFPLSKLIKHFKENKYPIEKINHLLANITYPAFVFSLSREPLTLIHMAAWSGNLLALKELSQLGVNLNLYTSDSGYHPLHLAARENHVEIIKYLILENKTHPDISTSTIRSQIKGESPLCCAAMKCNLEAAKLLYEYHASINYQDKKDDMTPLHYVCAYGGNNEINAISEMVDFLLMHGANVELKTKSGKIAEYKKYLEKDQYGDPIIKTKLPIQNNKPNSISPPGGHKTTSQQFNAADDLVEKKTTPSEAQRSIVNITSSDTIHPPGGLRVVGIESGVRIGGNVQITQDLTSINQCTTQLRNLSIVGIGSGTSVGGNVKISQSLYNSNNTFFPHVSTNISDASNNAPTTNTNVAPPPSYIDDRPPPYSP